MEVLKLNYQEIPELKAYRIERAVDEDGSEHVVVYITLEDNTNIAFTGVLVPFLVDAIAVQEKALYDFVRHNSKLIKKVLNAVKVDVENGE